MGRACIYLVTFGEDQEITAWIHSELSWALDFGLLRLASGGAEGQIHQGDPDMEFLDQLPVMDFWHASKAKNTSHMFAISSHELLNKGQLADLILVCLDADNVFFPDYVPEVANIMASNKEKALKQLNVPNKDMGDRSQVLGLTSRCASGIASLTGRVGLYATDFLVAGGYDQEEDVAPSGYQDVDLQLRVCTASSLQNGWAAKALSVKGGGCAFPNIDRGDMGSVGMSNQERRYERNEAKVVHCDPNFRALGWQECNKSNMKVMKAKTTAGRLVRNIEDEEYKDTNGVAVKFHRKLSQCKLALGAFVCWRRRSVTGIPCSANACSSDEAQWEAGAPEPTEACWPPRRTRVPNSDSVPLQPRDVHIFIMTAGQPGNVLQSGLAQRLRVMHFELLFQAPLISAREAWIPVRMR
jgi:hypothetical protein